MESFLANIAQKMSTYCFCQPVMLMLVLWREIVLGWSILLLLPLRGDISPLQSRNGCYHFLMKRFLFTQQILYSTLDIAVLML